MGERDTEWPAFVFVTTAAGSGWVPERYLSGDRPRARVLRGYSTLELPVTAGALLTLVEDDPESGWSWCTDGVGRSGWVPHAVLERVSRA